MDSKRPKIIAVIGRRGTGKTLVVEHLTSQLTKEGLKIAAVKSVHHKDFTIDEHGKDTWRMSQAGAKVVVSVAPKELTTIRKVDTRALSINRLLETAKLEDFDVVIMEGFRWLVGGDDRVFKIVTCKRALESADVLRDLAPPVLAVTCLENQPEAVRLGVPILRTHYSKDKLLSIVKEKIAH